MLQIIRLTLPKDAREFVQIDDQTGLIDKKLLLQYENSNGSENFSSLLELVSREEIYEVALISGEHPLAPILVNGEDYSNPIYFGEVRGLTKDEEFNGYSGDPIYNLTTGEAADGTLGQNIPVDLSATGNYQILINANLSLQGKIEVAAHEFFGHPVAEKKGINPSHQFSPNGDQNKALLDWITDRVYEALENFEK